MQPTHAFLALALAIVATRAGAQTVRDGVNGTRAPAADFYVTGSIGWFYTPAASYLLGGILTRFYADEGGTDRDVTIELLTAPRFDGGTLLRSATFNSAAARGRLGGAIFAAPISLVGGTSYFVGFRNVAPPNARDADLVPESALLGVSFTDDVDARSLGAPRVDDADVGLYEFRGTPGLADRPILQFVGPADVSTVPEPTSSILVGTGIAILALAARRRSRQSRS